MAVQPGMIAVAVQPGKDSRVPTAMKGQPSQHFQERTALTVQPRKDSLRYSLDSTTRNSDNRHGCTAWKGPRGQDTCPIFLKEYAALIIAALKRSLFHTRTKKESAKMLQNHQISISNIIIPLQQRQEPACLQRFKVHREGCFSLHSCNCF